MLQNGTDHVFKHPFTMTVSAPTGSGKSYLVYNILRNNRLQPSPRRIVVLYKRWQPLYDEMKKTIPNIEFMQGVPSGLDKDGYFNARKPNLLILDDLMSTTANNSVIADLFSEGSHHRNLSVINITQNLFPPGKISTTQRRNTQYMIIFKSPMSQDQIRTIGSFMFPGRVPKFLEIYQKATAPAYGYLLIDAKPDTPESYRFKHQLFVIKESEKRKSLHSSFDDQTDNTQNLNMVSCDQCGIMFEDLHDLQRHIQNWCPENPAKRARIEVEKEPEESVKVTYTTEAELPIFEEIWVSAEKANNKLWRQKLDQYVQQGMLEEDAEAKADERFENADEDGFLKLYETLLRQSLQLKNGLIHNKIVDAIRKYEEEGFALKHAVRKAIRDNKEEIMDMLNDDDASDDSDSESDDSDNDESQSGEESDDE